MLVLGDAGVGKSDVVHLVQRMMDPQAEAEVPAWEAVSEGLEGALDRS